MNYLNIFDYLNVNAEVNRQGYVFITDCGYDICLFHGIINLMKTYNL